MEARRDDGKTPARAIGQCTRSRVAALHEAATSSKMWPNFERFVLI
jgi:hypothetical protein